MSNLLFILAAIIVTEAVTFRKVADGEVKGEDYRRLKSGAPLMKFAEVFHDLNNPELAPKRSGLTESVTMNSSCTEENHIEQIYVTLGDDDGSLIVPSASFDFIPEVYVYYSDGKENKKVAATFQTYSAQLAVGSSYVYGSAMRAPFTTSNAIRSLMNSSNWAFDPLTGEHYKNYYNFSTWAQASAALANQILRYNNPFSSYDSPNIFTATLTGIKAGSTITYRITGSCKVSTVKYPKAHDDPSIYPMNIGLSADVGITSARVETIMGSKALEPDFALLVGDLCFADGWAPIWDAFGRLMQDTFSEIPLFTTGGNHEYGSAENNVHYFSRWPTPYKVSNSGSHNYYGREIGTINLIALDSYAQTGPSSLQYQWLSWYLQNRVNRMRTPWLIVMFHTPIYNSNSGHWKEAEYMRLNMEDLFYNAGVDLILSGHVHAYERTQPVYKNMINACGTVHLVIGDGDNYEGPYTPWRTGTSECSWAGFREVYRRVT